MVCAIAAQKLCVPVAHVEADTRSGDWAMPEEIKRTMTDAITNNFFTTSSTANESLRRAGVPVERIYFVGNTMIDTLLVNMERLRPPQFWDELGLKAGSYFVVTLHHPANVDETDHFARLLRAIDGSSRGLPVVFSVHPCAARTLQRLSATSRRPFGLWSRRPTWSSTTWCGMQRGCLPTRVASPGKRR